MHEDYVLRQIIHSLQDTDTDTDTIFFATNFLYVSVGTTESAAELLVGLGAVTRLVDLIADPRRKEDKALQSVLLDLFFEIARIQQLKPDDLCMLTPYKQRRF